MRISSQALIEQLDTNYIDAKLKDLSYDHASHLVRMRYGDSTEFNSIGVPC
ncbi:hypothetical protein J2Z66_005994 [Paenibacillus eucommiae]|uniref:Uncharacterized protein n=1 Tax=Paenibacillus eucommiae TaxID=1355755 RepID=A0ABS4J3E9_9BACL|nr:hypothetical protein [Paenibacillus eucommiae]